MASPEELLGSASDDDLARYMGNINLESGNGRRLFDALHAEASKRKAGLDKSPEMLERVVHYLEHPPLREVH